MKKVITFFILSFIILSICSCDNTKNKSKAETSQTEENKKRVEKVEVEIDCSTIGNFYIPQREAEDLMGHFEERFQKKGKPDEVKELIDSFWVDACIIINVKNTLNANPQYDGIRIYSSSAKPILGRRQSDILFVPTIYAANTHWAQWGKKIIKCSNAKFDNYNFKEEEAVKVRRDFEKNLRKEKIVGDPSSAEIPDLSRSVWFSKCVFDSLSKYLENATLNLDGVFIHCGAYRKIEAGRRQKYPYQSTFIFVLTKSDGSDGHQNAWEIINNLAWLKRDGGYNHGELCPDDCPSGEN